MKDIFNWQKATVADIEADNLLEDATKIHVLSYRLAGKPVKSIGKKDQDKRIQKFFQHHIDNQIPLVMHNGIGYDVPLVEKLLGMDLSGLMLIDTLALSWYLNFRRKAHGLGTFHEDYGIEKPVIDDWENLPDEDYEHRCREDVAINKALWEDFKERLIEIYSHSKQAIDDGFVGGKRQTEDEVIYLDGFVGDGVEEHINRILTFLMFKMDCARLQEKTRWEVDVDLLHKTKDELEGQIEAAKDELESVMPEVPKYAPRKKPAKPYKMNGELSVSGKAWEIIKESIKSEEKDCHGNPTVTVSEDGSVKVIKGYEPPNVNSPEQIKNFLYSKGWEPANFKYVRDKQAFQEWIESKPAQGSPRMLWTRWKSSKPLDRAVPQVSIDSGDGKELCHSVQQLAETTPEIMAYSKYTTVKHRLDMLKGFIENLEDGKYLKARIGGFANTLRVKHREIVNLPGVDKPYGEQIRGVFIAGSGKVSMGTDLSSLEDRVKHHFMLPHDPEYVETMMADDYDPHILTAFSAGMIDQETLDKFKAGEKTEEAVAARKAGKSCLPVDSTEVLTDCGWKTFEELSLGDRVLSTNTETGKNEFTEVLDTVFYENREVLAIENSKFKYESTPDHRWYGWKYVSVGGVQYAGKSFSYVKTEDLPANFNIQCSSPYVGGVSNVSPDEAALVGWILSDGHIRCSKKTGITSQGCDGRRQGFVIGVYQSTKKFYKEILELIHRLHITHTTRPMTELGEDGEVVMGITLKPQEGRDFWAGVGLPLKNKKQIDYSSWVLSLNQESLKAFVDAFWKADGWSAKKKYLDSKTFYQMAGRTREAIELACYLRGMLVTRGGERSFAAHSRKTYHTMQTMRRGYSRHCDVFCLTTGNGNFVIRQGGQITVTGNCNYASVYNAGPPTIARAAGVTVAQAEKLHEGYWKLNWSVKVIADEQYVFEDQRGGKWLVNPVNGLCYSLRKESDRFSTLAQGTGSFIFDMWVDGMLQRMQERHGTKRLTYSAHDEYVVVIKDNFKARESIQEIVQESIRGVNETYKLRRGMGCDVQFGQSYAEIH